MLARGSTDSSLDLHWQSMSFIIYLPWRASAHATPQPAPKRMDAEGAGCVQH